MLALRKGGHRDLERLYSAFELDFDRRELLPKLTIHKAMMAGDQELLVFYDEESGITAGYALVMVRGVYGYVLLKYFGILQWFREQGRPAGHPRGADGLRRRRGGLSAQAAEVFRPLRLCGRGVRLPPRRRAGGSDGQAHQRLCRHCPHCPPHDRRLLFPLPAAREL